MGLIAECSAAVVEGSFVKMCYTIVICPSETNLTLNSCLDCNRILSSEKTMY